MRRVEAQGILWGGAGAAGPHARLGRLKTSVQIPYKRISAFCAHGNVVRRGKEKGARPAYVYAFEIRCEDEFESRRFPEFCARFQQAFIRPAREVSGAHVTIASYEVPGAAHISDAAHAGTI